MIMFIHFFCLCPLSLTIKLNVDISKVAYSTLSQHFVKPKKVHEGGGRGEGGQIN